MWSYTQLLLTLSYLISVLVDIRLACETIQTTGSLVGRFCAYNFTRNLTSISPHQCTHRCISTETCAAVSYNTVGHFCILVSRACQEPGLDRIRLQCHFRYGQPVPGSDQRRLRNRPCTPLRRMRISMPREGFHRPGCNNRILSGNRRQRPRTA